MTPATTQTPSTARTWLVRLLPYIITAVVTLAILHKHPLDQILTEVRHGDVHLLFPLAIIMVLISLFLVSAADTLVTRACVQNPSHAQVAYTDIVRAKAGTSLLDVFNYAVGHGAYAIWIARFTGIRASHAGGVMLYIMSSDLTSVCVVASLSLLAAQLPAAATLGWIALLVAVFLLFTLLTAPYQWLGETPRIFTPWIQVPRTLGLLQIGLRMVQMSAFVLMTWLAARSFGLAIPLPAMAVYLPILMLIASLPANVAGFGAVQGVWLLLFEEYAAGPQILAFHALWSLACAAAVVLRGLPFARRIVAEVDQSKHTPQTTTHAEQPP